MHYEKHQLKNRANIIFVPLKDTASVTVLVIYPTGSRYESEPMSGVSHFVEHMMFKGTKKRPSTLILTREIDRLGAQYNAFTSKEYTGYYIKTDGKYLSTACDILADMLNNSLFQDKEMKKEKTVIVEELRMYKDNPIMNIESVFESLMFEGCPLAVDVGGTEKHVMSYSRKDVLDYKNKYYQAGNTTIVVAGNLDETNRKIARRYFGQAKSAKVNQENALQVFQPAIFGSAEKAKRLKIERKKTDQVQMIIGFPGFKHQDTKNNIISTVMDTIFGGSMSSRLFIQVRERHGLAYMVGSGSDCFRDTGYHYIRLGLEAKNINKAIALIKKETEKLKKLGPTKREFADAITHIHGALTLTLEDSGAQANWYAHQALFMKHIKTPKERLKELEGVSLNDVKTMAKTVYNWDEARIAVIGDVEAKSIVF